MNNTRRIVAAGLAAALALGISACSSSGGSKSTGSTGSAKGASGLSAETQQAVDAAYKGDFAAPPTSSPKPQAGKNIWLVTLSASVIDYRASGQIGEAAKDMGWKLTIFDGKFDPDTIVSGLRQAVAAKANGIILSAVDCATVKAGLQDVQKAHIPVIGVEATDCDSQVSKGGVLSKTGQPGLFTAQPLYRTTSGGLTPFVSFYGAVYAPYQALGIAEGTKGNGKIIALNETDTPLLAFGVRSFRDRLKTACPRCTIVDTINFVGTDLGSALQQKVSQALVQHPDANAVYSIYDAPAADVAAAVSSSGRKNSIFVMGGEGTAPVVDLVRAGRGVNAGVGYSVSWEGWAALDALNRLFHGEKPSDGGFPSGMGAQLYDKAHNMPVKGQRFDGPVDYRAAYRKAWGVS